MAAPHLARVEKAVRDPPPRAVVTVMAAPRVFVDRFPGGVADLGTVIRALEWLGAGSIVRPDTRVFVKPNLTWKEPVPGVTTTPAFLGAVVATLRDMTRFVIVGESDGGYHSFAAEEAFQSHGLFDLARRYDVRLVNLSKGVTEQRTVTVGGRPVTVELAALLLHEIDVFVSLPVPKVHALTHVSLGFKNQWGCQPSTMRLRNHPDFARKILAINVLVHPRLVMFDGTFFLDRMGPMNGEAVSMGLLVAADDAGAGSLACCEIMGISVERVPHLRLAQAVGMMPSAIGAVEVNQELTPFRVRRFRLKRSPISYIALAAFHSRLGTRLFYESAVADVLHRILYTIRRNRLIGRILYGPTGPPAGCDRRRV